MPVSAVKTVPVGAPIGESKTITLEGGREVTARLAVSIPLVGSRTLEGWIVEKRVNHAESKEVRAVLSLGVNGVTAAVALPALSENPDAHKPIRGNMAWLDGVRLTGDTRYTWDADGRLINPTENTDPERLVRVYPGDQPVRITICTDHYTASWGMRFHLYAGLRPGGALSVVLGIREKAADILRKDSTSEVSQPSGAE